MNMKPLAKNSGQSALTDPRETALVIIDEHARLSSSMREKAWWSGRTYEPAVELATLFDVPHVVYLTLTGAGDRSADSFSKISNAYAVVASTQINPWRESAFVEAINATGRSKLLISGYCALGGVTFAVLDALLRGYDVSYVADTSVGRAGIDSSLAVERMIQAGAVPLSWRQLALEWQADWANQVTRSRVIELLGF